MINNKYSRIDAVNYAKTYALFPNQAYKYFPLIDDTSGDCTNFISQCLFAGGASMNFSSTNPWWYKKSTWSVSWTVANSLYWLLKTNEANKALGVKGLETEDINSLQLGDVIFFENEKKVVFHGTIITGFLDSKPLISQHSFDAKNIDYKQSWKATKVHFLKISI